MTGSFTDLAGILFFAVDKIHFMAHFDMSIPHQLSQEEALQRRSMEIRSASLPKNGQAIPESSVLP
jgi:hypothetical protein